MFTIREIKKNMKTAIRSAISPGRLIEFYRRMLAVGKSKTSVKTAICSAISPGRLIEFYYRGGTRLVEPFCLGKIAPGDEGSLLCYQVSGYAKFGDPVGWKLYRLPEISRLKVINQNFAGDRPDYDPDNLQMTTIYCCVSVTADDATKLRETTELVQPSRKVSLSYERNENRVVSCQKHNEQMEEFRLSHASSQSGLSDSQD